VGIEKKFNIRRRTTVIRKMRKMRKKNSAFLNKRWAVEKKMVNIIDNFVNVKCAERKLIKRVKNKKNG